MPDVKIAPSILAADFSRLGRQVADADRAGADLIHIDVMDGHFVPNISIGPDVVRWLRPVTDLPLDVHLMIENPGDYVEKFADAGADSLTVHYEACTHLHRVVQKIRARELKVGVALNPATPIEALSEILPELHLVLIMTVNPGFGGQQYIRSSTAKIVRLKEVLKARQLAVEIQVDGGIDAVTAAPAVLAGASNLVAGSAIFNRQGTIEENLSKLRDAASIHTGTDQ